MLKFKVISPFEIYEEIGEVIDRNHLYKYDAERPGILENVDVFCPNSRIDSQEYTRFDLFERVEDDNKADFFVFSIYLELFEYSNSDKIIECVEYYSLKYPDRKIIFQWNHDNDYSKHGKHIEKFENVLVNNFGNTTVRHKNDITLPFWNMNTKFYNQPKTNFCGFIGTINNQFRKSFVENIISYNHPDFIHESGLNPEDFYRRCSSLYFNLCPLGGAGGSGFSYRFFETFHLNSVPVLIVDKLIYPYQDDINFDEISIVIGQDKISDMNHIHEVLKSHDVESMLKRIKKVRHKFTLGGVQEEVYRRLND